MPKYLVILVSMVFLSSCSDKDAPLLVNTTITNSEYTVTTVVGGDTAGDADGTGDAAELDGPAGVTVASDGTVWMTDDNNNSVRAVDPDAGTIVTEANTAGDAGFADGDADTARFNHPDGLAVDRAGDIYVADVGNNAIRKINVNTGIVSTIAGGGSSGSDDGSIAAASFNSPAGIIVDNDDDNILYIADENNHVVRKLDLSAGQVSTIIGLSNTPGDEDNNGTSARLNRPHGITMGADGYIYVTDMGNHKVKKFHKTTLDVVSIAGDGNAGDSDRLDTPHGIAVDSIGNVFVADQGNNKVKKISTGSIVRTIAGTGLAGFSDAVGNLAKLNTPTGLAIDSSGTLYLCDYENNRIRKIAK